MSREIKFRVYISKYKILDTPDIINFNTQEVKYDSDYYSLDDIELMQFTGLKDSEGYEIYEDDIVWNEWDEEYQVIIYDEGEYKLMDESHIQNLYDSLDYIDIRGNVYENVELIGGWYND